MPDIAGQQARQLCSAMENAGGTMSRIALDMQQQADQVRVDDALNQAKEASLKLTYDKDVGYTNIKGQAALQRDSGQLLSDEYAGKLREQVQAIQGSLGNDNQRRAFAAQAGGMVTAFHGQAMAHESQEFKNYSLSTSEGIQSTALRDIGLNWNNPDAVGAAVERIKAETFRQAQLLGKSAEWQEAQARKMASNGHKVALLTALDQNNPEYAESYLNKFAGSMDADDILAVRGHITKEMNVREGVAAAADTFQKYQPQLQVGEADRAFNIALGTESGNRQFGADGKPLTSSAGAVGIAQVMPATAPEAAKLAGLPWDENRYRNDAAYNKALGLAYFQKQLQDFGGDVGKAYAAYNAGPGALRNAITLSERTRNPGGAGDWLSLLPKETQNYVAKNMAEFNAGGGKPTPPTQLEMEAQLRADPRLAGNPERMRIARTELNQRYEELTKAQKAQDDQNVSKAMQALEQVGGRWSDVPVAIRSAVPRKEVDNLMKYGQSISKGDDITNNAVYAKLAGDPQALARMSDDEFYKYKTVLSQSDFQHFASERGKARGDLTGANRPGDLNSGAIKQALDERLLMVGVNPNPKATDADATGRVGGIRKFINDEIGKAQANAGRKFSDVETAQFIDRAFATNATFKGFFSNTSKPTLAATVEDLDSKTKDSIKQAYKTAGIDNPTNAQLMSAFWRQQKVGQ